MSTDRDYASVEDIAQGDAPRSAHTLRRRRPALVSNARAVLAKGAAWTIGIYSVVQILRFLTNVIITRLLAPELFGVMIVVNTIRTGAELMSDIGASQCVIKAEDGEDPTFYNTAWTLQAIRGALLLAICAAAAPLIAHAYGKPELAWLIAVAAIGFLISGLTSMAPALLQRSMELGRLNLFELGNVFAFAIFQIAVAYLYPTVWSLIFGLLFGAAFRMVGSFFLLEGLSHRFELSAAQVQQIFKFGKWVGAASLVYFLASSFDRLYLAGAIPLAMLGIYGIARTITEVVSSMAASLGGYVVFPFVAAHATESSTILRRRVASHRLGLLLLFASGIGLLIGIADLLVALVFDARYQAAGPMASILFFAAWFSILGSINEATLLGIGKPAYGAMANTAKLLALAIALPIGVAQFGIMGAVAAAVLAEVCRYIPLVIGQIRADVSFLGQDAFATLMLAATLGCVLWAREAAGLALHPWFA